MAITYEGMYELGETIAAVKDSTGSEIKAQLEVINKIIASKIPLNFSGDIKNCPLVIQGVVIVLSLEKLLQQLPNELQKKVELLQAQLWDEPHRKETIGTIIAFREKIEKKDISLISKKLFDLSLEHTDACETCFLEPGSRIIQSFSTENLKKLRDAYSKSDNGVLEKIKKIIKHREAKERLNPRLWDRKIFTIEEMSDEKEQTLGSSGPT